MKGLRETLKVLGAFGAPLLLIVPLEVSIVKARIEAVVDPAGTSSVDPSFLDRVNFVFNDRPVLWRIILLGAVAAIVVLWDRRHETQWRIGAAVLFVAVGTTALFDEPRLAYLLPTAAALGLAVWSPELRRLTNVPILGIFVAVACVFQFMAMPSTTKVQVNQYQALTPAVVEAIDWLKANSTRDDLVAVTPYHDGPALGWWIEGLADRRTLTGSNLRWLHFESERETARKSAKIFAGGVPTVRRLRLALDNGVRLLFVDKRWDGYESHQVGVLRTRAPSSIVFSNRDVVILTTEHLAEANG